VTRSGKAKSVLQSRVYLVLNKVHQGGGAGEAGFP